MLMAQLKAATREQHLQLEHAVNLKFHLQDRRCYAQLLLAMYGIYAPLELRLLGVDWTPAQLAIRERVKTPWLRGDLACLGVAEIDVSTAPECARLPSISSLAQAIGVAYVLEGATLGGDIIAKQLVQRLGVTSGAGGTFHASYGPAIGRMWGEFCERAEKYCDGDVRRQAAIASAVSTFECFSEWMRARREAIAR